MSGEAEWIRDVFAKFSFLYWNHREADFIDGETFLMRQNFKSTFESSEYLSPIFAERKAEIKATFVFELKEIRN